MGRAGWERGGLDEGWVGKDWKRKSWSRCVGKMNQTPTRKDSQKILYHYQRIRKEKNRELDTRALQVYFFFLTSPIFAFMYSLLGGVAFHLSYKTKRIMPSKSYILLFPN